MLRNAILVTVVVAMPASAATQLADPSEAGVLQSAASTVPPSLFGIKAGEPLTLPGCPASVPRYTYTEMCAANPGSTSTRVYFAVGLRPTYVKFGTIEVELRAGVVAGITVFTDGVRSQEAVYADLLTKFGKPGQEASDKQQNMMGASFAVRTASWTIGNYQVFFAGALDTFNSGVITIENDVIREEQRAKSKRTPL